jgi:hypothetical protein
MDDELLTNLRAMMGKLQDELRELQDWKQQTTQSTTRLEDWKQQTTSQLEDLLSSRAAFLSNTETTKSVQTKADKINSINENEDHDEETAGDLNSINANEGTPGIAEEDD